MARTANQVSVGPRRRLIIGGAATLGFAGGRFSWAAEPLLIFAAASLKNALDDVLLAWRDQGHAPVRVSYGGTSTIARQLMQGAPADIFIGADQEWLAELQQHRVLQDASIRPLLGNRLALIVPINSPITAQRLPIRQHMPIRSALGENGRLALGDPAHVPGGRYAKAALSYYGVWNDVRDHLAPMNNVRLALALVARGECPLGVVYRSDALAEPRVRELALFDAQSHPAIRYPLAITRASRHAQAAPLALFLAQERARTIFRRHGFDAPV